MAKLQNNQMNVPAAPSASGIRDNRRRGSAADFLRAKIEKKAFIIDATDSELVTWLVIK